MFESGNNFTGVVIFIEDQLARWVSNGLEMFMVFWAANYWKYGGENGVLGVFYLSGAYYVLGFCNWAWNRWD